MSNIRYLDAIHCAIVTADYLDVWLGRGGRWLLSPQSPPRRLAIELAGALVRGASPVDIWVGWAVWLCGRLASIEGCSQAARECAALFTNRAPAAEFREFRRRVQDLKDSAWEKEVACGHRHGLSALEDLASDAGAIAECGISDARCAFSRIARGDTSCPRKYEEGGEAFMRQAAEMFSVAVRRAVEARR